MRRTKSVDIKSHNNQINRKREGLGFIIIGNHFSQQCESLNVTKVKNHSLGRTTEKKTPQLLKKLPSKIAYM